jgi:hypothetical protein
MEFFSGLGEQYALFFLESGTGEGLNRSREVCFRKFFPGNVSFQLKISIWVNTIMDYVHL